MTNLIIFMSGGVIHSIEADGKGVRAFVIDEDKEGAGDDSYRKLLWPGDKKGQEIARVAFEWGQVEVAKRTVKTLSKQILDDNTLATFCQVCMDDFFKADMVKDQDGDNYTCQKCLEKAKVQESKPLTKKKI